MYDRNSLNISSYIFLEYLGFAGSESINNVTWYESKITFDPSEVKIFGQKRLKMTLTRARFDEKSKKGGFLFFWNFSQLLI